MALFYPNYTYYIAITWIGICAFIGTYSLFNLLYNIYIHDRNVINQRKRLNKWYKTALILCSLGCVFCIYADLSREIYCFVTKTYIFEGYVDNIFALPDALYYIGSLSFYIVAYTRIN
eukprot:75967_1